MSIPPLVCSTPPPPEQCEDDKDHEDFDLTYNLSQEDEDEDSTEYNYGNYSGYNIFPPKSEQTDKNDWASNFKEETQKGPEGVLKSVEITSDVNLLSNDNNKFDDNILEDLNLKVDSDNVHSNNTPTKEYETEADIYNNESSDKNSMFQDQGGTDHVVNVEGDAIESTKPLDSAATNVIDRLDCENNEAVENTEGSSEDLSEITLEDKISIIKSEQYILPDSMVLKNDQEILENIDHLKNKDVIVDDFEDFDEFQFTHSNTTQVLPVNYENPWNKNDSESSDFGDFTANFDDANTKKTVEEIPSNNKDTAVDDCEDDFGDFDDFKSVNNAESIEDKELTLTSNVSVNNVLSSIFTYEISEPENELDGKLELYLNETWGHLIDIDVRQPYIINWNNSLGQKTLLKALCIDSRNILFGPKWNYSMPKYATNLSTAPLQPQKQLAQSNTSNTEVTEKVPNKETSTWVDPFTPDGQEYTYAEALLLDLEHLMATLDQMAHKHSTLKISELLSHACSTENDIPKTETIKRPTDLDVFASEPSKINKIYSNTINVQPLRHINLPDTHIFTPTDSETPRSKTIHYDSGPPSLVPQSVIEPTTSQSVQQISQSSNTIENDNDYWEFQDFKGITTDVTSNTVNKITEQSNIVKALPDGTTAKAGITYQTQILQPIKLEPIIPTLNWPDPGEVKETFEDFSDFVSSSSEWNEKDTTITESDVKIVETKLEPEPKTDKMEDEFETFQSAPVTISGLDISVTFESPQNLISNNSTKVIKENYEHVGTKKESNSVTGSNFLFLENKGSVATNISGLQNITKSNNNVISHNHTNSDILLPINSNAAATTIRSQHNTGQILQPLSLESYSQINWPNPGIDLQDLSRFNPMNSLNSLKRDVTPSNSKVASPAHNSVHTVHHEASDDDIWGEFVSNVPKAQQTSPKKNITFADDDEWTDFVSSPSIKPQNGLNTISLNVHTNSNMQKVVNQNKFPSGSNQIQLDIPTLNYITPKSNSRGIYMEKHFQNL